MNPISSLMSINIQEKSANFNRLRPIFSKICPKICKLDPPNISRNIGNYVNILLPVTNSRQLAKLDIFSI